jgi:transketolase C-terminal domain/subunit
MLAQAFEAADLLSAEGIEASIYSYPFLGSKLDKDFLLSLEGYSRIIVLENHLPALGNFHAFNEALPSKNVIRVGLNELPKNGRNGEVLNFHKLDAENISRLAKG